LETFSLSSVEELIDRVDSENLDSVRRRLLAVEATTAAAKQT
jgi:hypothetical protein